MATVLKMFNIHIDNKHGKEHLFSKLVIVLEISARLKINDKKWVGYWLAAEEAIDGIECKMWGI